MRIVINSLLPPPSPSYNKTRPCHLQMLVSIYGTCHASGVDQTGCAQAFSHTETPPSPSVCRELERNVVAVEMEKEKETRYGNGKGTRGGLP